MHAADDAGSWCDSQVLDERVGIAPRGHDRKLPVGCGHGERRDPTRYGLHDEVKDSLANGTQAGRVCESTREAARRGIKRPGRAATAARSTEVPRKLDEILSRSRPVPLEEQDHRRAWRCSETDQRPVVLVGPPEVNTQAEGHANAIKCVRAAVGEMGE